MQVSLRPVYLLQIKTQTNFTTMKVFLTESEVLELSVDYLDINQPNPDKAHDIALKMDMVYDEDLDMYEDVEEHSLRKIIRTANPY